jgi:hypothetical protein
MSYDDERTAAVLMGRTPPEADLGLCVTQQEYDEIEARLSGLEEPSFDDVMQVLTSVLGQHVVDRMQGHVVGIEVVAELPDERWFHRTSPMLS